MNKIAIAAENNNLQSQLAIRAGRCKWFCILDKNGNTEFVENPGFTARAAFGFYAFNFLKEKKVDTVIARFFGPRFQELSKNHAVSLIVPPSDVKKVKDVIEQLSKNIV